MIALDRYGSVGDHALSKGAAVRRSVLVLPEVPEAVGGVPNVAVSEPLLDGAGIVPAVGEPQAWRSMCGWRGKGSSAAGVDFEALKAQADFHTVLAHLRVRRGAGRSVQDPLPLP